MANRSLEINENMDPSEILPQMKAMYYPIQEGPENEEGLDLLPGSASVLLRPTPGFDFEAKMKAKIKRSKSQSTKNPSGSDLEVRPRRHSPSHRLKSVWDSENDLRGQRRPRIPSPPPQNGGSRFQSNTPYVPSTPLKDLSPMLQVKDYLTFAAFLAPLSVHHMVIPKPLDEEVLGEGVTFRVSRCSLPPGLGGLGSVSLSSGVVALKRVKSKRFNLTNVAVVDEKIVRDLCLEMRILLHPPLRRHRNIVGIFSIGWEISDGNKRAPLPLLVMECAELGNLQDYQSSTNLPWEEKSRLCLEIASGLQSLHECGIIHGDVKSENILLFHDKEFTFVPKLADFGCSLLDQDTDTGGKVPLGGTRIWAAPEVFEGPIRVDLAPKTDVFSFGLLVWRICIDGQNPFLQAPFNGAGKELDIQSWKKQDDFVQICMGHAKALLEKAPEACFRLPEVMEATLSRNAQSRSHMGDILEVLMQKSGPTKPTESLEAVPRIFLPTHMGERPKEILNCMLLDDKYIQAGQYLPNGVKKQITSELLERASKLGPQCCQHCITHTKIDRCPETLTFSDLVQITGEDACPFVSGDISRATEAAFELCYCFTVGFGVEICYTKALHWLALAAKNGLRRAQAAFKPLYDSFGIVIPEDLPYMKWLFSGTIAGSRESLEYLSRHSPKFHKVLQEVFLRVYQGRGWRFWTDGYLGISWPVDNISLLRPKVLKYMQVHRMSVDDIIVDGDPGDRLLHLSAACGFPDTIEFLHKDIGANINQVNIIGETPLLAACRSGQVACLDILLKHNAEIQTATKDGVTALHWLFSFTSAEMQYVCQQLHSLRADLNVKSSPIQLTFQDCTPILFCGTPLHWAITVLNFSATETLLKQGADPGIINGLGKTPLQLAASLHFVKGVEILLPYAEQGSFLELIRVTIRDISPFFHRLQFGSLWRETAIETVLLVITAASKKATDYAQILRVLCEESVRRWPMDLVDSLLDAVPKPHRQITLPPDPLHFTILSGRFEDFSRLLERYLKSFSFDPCTCEPPLLLAAASADDSRFAQTLLKLGADPGLRGKDGFSPFEIAVINKAFKTADLMLDNLSGSQREVCFGAYSPEVFGTQHGPLTTLGHLLSLPQLGIDSLEYMLKLKLDIGFIVSPKSNANALHVVAATFQVSERPEIVRRYRRYLSILLNNFKDPSQLNSVDNFGRTPLHWAVEAGNAEAVGEFLKAGAKPDHRGGNSGTALDEVIAILEGICRNDPVNREFLKLAGGPKRLFGKIQKLLISRGAMRGIDLK